MAEHDEGDQQKQQGDNDAGPYIGNKVFALVIDISAERYVDLRIGPGIEQRAGLLGDGYLLRTDDSCHAAAEEHAGHGHDERLDLQITYQKALEDTEYHADGQNDQDHHDGVDAAAHAYCQRHAVHGDQGAHGDIDTGRQHDDGQSAGDTDQSGVGDQDIQERLQMRKAFMSVSDTSACVQNDEQGDRDQQKNGMSVKSCFLHYAAPFACFAMLRLFM